MAKSEQQRQKKLAKLKSKQLKQRREANRRKNQLSSLSGRMATVATRPVAICCFSSQAYQAPGLARVFFGRFNQAGEVELTVWLLDNACLGVKDAYAASVSKSEMEEYVDRLDDGDLIDSDPDTVLSLIQQSIDYARGNGFPPPSQVAKLLPIFGDADPTTCEESFAFGGQEGLPTYIRGPFESSQRAAEICHTLEKTVGVGNYHFLVTSSDFEEPLADLGDVTELDAIEWREAG